MVGFGSHPKMSSEGKEREAICDLPGVRGAGRGKYLASSIRLINSAVMCFLSGVWHAYHTFGVLVAPVQACTTVMEIVGKGTLMQQCREYACTMIMHN